MTDLSATAAAGATRTTDVVAAATPEVQATRASLVPERLSWDSRARRVVLVYVPLACFVLILLFPFYWMAITSFKPNAEL